MATATRKRKALPRDKQCGVCGQFFTAQGIGGHGAKHGLAGQAKGDHSLRAPTVAEKPDHLQIHRNLNPGRPVSTRNRYMRRGEEELRAPIDQLPDRPNIRDSAGGFVMDPQGATIAEIVNWYPVGGMPEDGISAKYSVNGAEYRRRYIEKRGKVWLGPVITPAHIDMIVEVMENNRADEINQCEYDIEQAEKVQESRAAEDVRVQASRRIDQLRARVRNLRQLIDKEAIKAELGRQARAKRLAAMSPDVRDAFLLSLEEGEGNRRLREMVAKEVVRHMQPEIESDPDLQPVGSGVVRHNPAFEGTTDDFRGKEFIDVDDLK